jgi:hypothetical protein
VLAVAPPPQIRPLPVPAAPRPGEPRRNPRWITHVAYSTHGQTAGRTEPGAADLAKSDAAPPRELCSGESRRRPARPTARGRLILDPRPKIGQAEVNQTK